MSLRSLIELSPAAEQGAIASAGQSNVASNCVSTLQSAWHQKISTVKKLDDVLLKTIRILSDTVMEKGTMSFFKFNVPSRNLLSRSEDRKEPALKVLIGSVGSMTNNEPYVKGLLAFLSQQPNHPIFTFILFMLQQILTHQCSGTWRNL